MNSFLELMAAWLVIMLVPGQDMALILRTTVAYGFNSAMKIVAGICVALAIHIFIASSSLGFLLVHSPRLFSFVQKMGAVYIAYLGFTFLFSAWKNKLSALNDGSGSLARLTSLQWMRMGFLSTILNPKVLVFFFSIFSSLMSESIPLVFILACGLGILLQTILFDFIFIKLLSSKGASNVLQKHSRKVEAASGFVLILLAVKLYTWSR